MEDASNTVQILVACAMQGIRFSSINCLWWGGKKETVGQMKVCAMYSIRFTRMNCLWLGKRTKTVQYNKMCVTRDKQVCNQKCVRRPIITQTITSNKTMWYALSTQHVLAIGGRAVIRIRHKYAKRHPISARTSCSTSSSSKRTLKLSVLRLTGWEVVLMLN